MFSEYDFDLHHIPGKINVCAGALSQRPDHVPEYISSKDPKIQCARTLHDAVSKRNIAKFVSIDVPVLQTLTCANLLTDATLIEQLRMEAEDDRDYQAVPTSALEGYIPDITTKDGLVWYTPSQDVQPRLLVPADKTRQTLIRETHDAAGHLDVHKTHESLQRLFYWPKMFHSAHEYVRMCLQCLRNKSIHQRPMGLLQPLPLPDHWEKVSHDLLITGLPKGNLL